MAIKIKTQETYIPIQLGELELRFDISDETVQNFRTEVSNVQKELEEIAKDTEEENAVNQAKKTLKKGFELLFGEGAFDKVYKVSPSIIICMDYFAQMSHAIDNKLREMGRVQDPHEKAKKYLVKKK